MMPQLAVSTWSVHRQLGITYVQGPDDSSGRLERTFGSGALKLSDLPDELVRRQIHRVEICHFHLASREPDYLAGVRDAFTRKGVAIQTLLIDKGDITHPTNRQRDIDWIGSWIDAAVLLGAERARVIAGKGTPTAGNLDKSVDALMLLGKHGSANGVRIVTENWFDLMATPTQVHYVLDALNGEVGFLADTGNWDGPTKYDDLESIYARAELSHTKCSFSSDHGMDREDYRLCLAAAVQAGYRGPHTLIFEGQGDEWRGVELERDFVLDHYAQADHS